MADYVGSSDGSGSSPNQSAEEGEDMEGENPSNGDDDQSETLPYYRFEKYVDSIGRIRARLTPKCWGKVPSRKLLRFSTASRMH